MLVSRKEKSEKTIIPEKVCPHQNSRRDAKQAVMLIKCCTSCKTFCTIFTQHSLHQIFPAFNVVWFFTLYLLKKWFWKLFAFRMAVIGNQWAAYYIIAALGWSGLIPGGNKKCHTYVHKLVAKSCRLAEVWMTCLLPQRLKVITPVPMVLSHGNCCDW